MRPDHLMRRLFGPVLLLALILGLLSNTSAPGSADSAKGSAVKSWPPDTHRYTRQIVANDQIVAASIRPPVLLIDPVVNNTNLGLSGSDSLNDGETSIAVNPDDPSEIVISSFRWGWGNSVSIMHTTDQGLTWTEEFSVPIPPGWPGGCPCDWAFDYGRANLVSGTILANSPTVAKGTDIVTGTSSDPSMLGAWAYFDPPGPPVQAQETNFNAIGNVDRPHIVVNRDPSNPAQDNAYVVYADFNGGPDVRVSVAYGTNPPDFTADNLVAVGHDINPAQVMAKDPRTGIVYVQWGVCNGGCGSTGTHDLDYMLSRSTDGGATWGLNGSGGGIVVASAQSTIGGKYGANAILAPWHHGAVDPTTGDYYYVYGDRDGGTGNNRLSIRRLTGDGSGGMVVGPSHFVTGQVQAFIPSVAVADDGTVGVFYYTFDGYSSDDYPIYTAHLAMSTDRGETFEDQVLTTFLSSAKVDPSDAKQRVLGDYMQMKTLGRVFYGAFTANGVQFGRPYADHDPIFFRTAVGPLIAVKAPLDFGEVCRGTQGFRQLEIYNTGTADLLVTSVAPVAGSDPAFTVDSNPQLPLSISPGSHVDFAVYCVPQSIGSHSATIRISSNDPDSPNYDVTASCQTPPGDIRVTGSADFGNVCVGPGFTPGDVVAEKTISICNVGRCDLRILGVDFNPPCADFGILNNPFPAVISHDACVSLTIGFHPDASGSSTCNLRIQSDDPDQSTINIPVTANVPAASIDVAASPVFPPTVTQDVGACRSLQPFPISNKGPCPLVVTSISISGVNAGDFGLSGLPSFPIILAPGHLVGDGNLSLFFAPTVVARHREASVTVTYVADPVTGSTATQTRDLCGEGVRTGARVLVTDGASPYSQVKTLKLLRINANRNKNRVDTVESLKNVPLTTVGSESSCPGFSFHREYGTESNPIQLLPGSYQLTASVVSGKSQLTKTVGFDVGTCDFNPQVVVDFSALSGVTITPAGEGDGSGGGIEGTPRNWLADVQPNPLVGSSEIVFSLASEGNVRLEVFNLSGARVRTLLEESLPAGIHQVAWDGRDEGGRTLSRGVYFVRLMTREFAETRKVVLTP